MEKYLKDGKEYEKTIVEFDEPKDGEDAFKRTWMPKMEEITLITAGIYDCEEKKYPRELGKQGGIFFLKYMLDYVLARIPIETLNKKYKFPKKHE